MKVSLTKYSDGTRNLCQGVRHVQYTIWGKHYCIKKLLFSELLSNYKRSIQGKLQSWECHAIPNNHVHLCIRVSLENAYPG